MCRKLTLPEVRTSKLVSDKTAREYYDHHVAIVSTGQHLLVRRYTFCHDSCFCNRLAIRRDRKTAMLSDSQISQYEQDGFLFIENALTASQLEQLQSATRQLIEQSVDVTTNNDRYDLDVGHSPQQPRLTRIKLPHLLHPIFWQVITSTRITELIKPLLKTDNIRLHTSKLNTKEPHGGQAVEWHQDWAFYPHTNDDLLAIGILLEDVEEQNGPLMAIPGTHRGPVLEHSKEGIFCGAIDPADPLFEKDKAVTLTGKAGSLSIHHVRTLHGSAPNHSDRARKVLFYECGAADAWPINGNSSTYTGMSQQVIWHELQQRIICGTQPTQARLENVPVTMPVAPPPDATSIFKVQKSGGAVSAFSEK